MRGTRVYLGIGFLACMLVLSSCSGAVFCGKHACARPKEVVVVKPGPPSHAPAHGYRHKHGRVVLVYEASLALYVVDGHEGYYFSDGCFYRCYRGDWQISAHFEGPWKRVSMSKVPSSLHRNEHRRIEQAKVKSKGSSKAKSKS